MVYKKSFLLILGLLMFFSAAGITYAWTWSTAVGNGDTVSSDKWNSLVTQLIAVSVQSDWNAVSGYAQILNKPAITNPDWNAVSGLGQILNKPVIPAAQVNSDWNSVSGVSQILNKPWTVSGVNQYSANSGNVGIGTTSPGSKLAIYGDATASWLNAAIYIGDTSVSGRVYSVGSRNGVGFHIGDETAGQSRFVINASGNVGIGTTNPITRTQVSSAVGTTTLRIEDTKGSGGAGASTASIGFAVNDGAHNIGGGDTAKIQVGANAGTYGYIDFLAYNQGTTPIMRILGTGNVGIGTTTPPNKLTVEGGVTEIRTGGYLMLRPSANDWDMRLQAIAGNKLGIYSGGDLVNPIATFVNGGNVGIGTTSPNRRLDISSNAGSDGLTIGQTVDNTESIQGYIDGQYANRTTYAGGCCNALLLQPDVGVVGIGTTTPQAKLDVNGTVKATKLNVVNGGYYRMNLAHCSGPCAGTHPLNVWTNIYGYTWSEIYNTDPANFVKSGGTITINEAGVYRIVEHSMAIPAAASSYIGAASYCPFINGGANCLGYLGWRHGYEQAGYWTAGDYEFTAPLAAGTTVAYGLYEVQSMTYWCHDSYCSLEITRIN